MTLRLFKLNSVAFLTFTILLYRCGVKCIPFCCVLWIQLTRNSAPGHTHQ